MITPESPERKYSTRLRTALILAGSGTAGAYQAGVLRALHEAGIKIDLVAGRGAGVVSAMFAAMDGGARLWDDNGLWRRTGAGGFYRWRRPLRIAGWSLATAGAILVLPIALLVLAMVIALTGMLLTFVGLESAGTAANAAYSRWIETLFAPTAVPTYIPRLACTRRPGSRCSGACWHCRDALFESRQTANRSRACGTSHRRAVLC